MSSLARNTAWLTLGKTFSVAIYALFGLVLPQLVTTAVNGVYTLMSTLLFFGSMASTFGVPTILIRTIARDPTRASAVFVNARRAMLAGAGLSAVAVMLYLLGEMAWQRSFDAERLILAAFVCAILGVDALGGLGEALCQSRERMVFPARVEVLTGALRGGGALACLLLFPGGGLYGVFACFLVGSTARGLIMLGEARRLLAGQELPPATWPRTFGLLRESIAVAVFRLLRMMRNRVDSLLLGLLVLPAAGLSLMETADSARALYGQAMRVIFVFHTFTTALNTAIFPRMARLTAGEGGLGEARVQFARVVRYQAWWASLLAAAVFGYADQVAGWFGPEYRDGIAGIQGTTGQALRLLLVAVLLDSIGGPIGMVMVGRPEMDRKLPWFGGALAASNLVLNLLLIPRYGLIGAGCASLGASVIELGLKTHYARVLLGSARPLLGALPYLPLAAGAVYALRWTPLATHPLLGGAVAAAVYLAVCLALGLVDPALTRRVRAWWERRRA